VLGPWEGMSEAEIAQRYPCEWNIWNTKPADLKWPGRETLNELLERVLHGVRRITDSNRNNDLNIVIVTHVAIIRVLTLWNINKSLNLYKKISVENGGIYKISLPASRILKIS